MSRKAEPNGPPHIADRGSGKTDAERSADKSAGRSLPPCDPLDKWLASKRLLILAGIVVASVLVRIFYYVEIADSPLSVQHHWDQSDMCYFDVWAQEIAAGDWLSRGITPPLHLWHYEVAQDYFRRYPDELVRLRPAAASMADRFFSKHPETDSILGSVARAQGEPYPARIPRS